MIKQGSSFRVTPVSSAGITKMQKVFPDRMVGK